MTTTIPTPAPVPDPLSSDFGSKAYDFTVWMAEAAPAMTVVGEEINTALNLSLLGVTTSSTTSLTIATGAQSLTVGTGLGIAVGMPLKITRTSDVTKYMKGAVTAYNSGTGVLNLTVATINGSGTFTDWTIAFDIPDAPAAPGWVLLETVTASASSTVSIETGFTSAYDDYVLIVSNFFTSASGSHEMLLKQGGAYITTGYNYSWSQAASAYQGAQSNASNTAIPIMHNMASSTNAANFRVFFNDVNSTTRTKSIDWNGRVGQLGQAAMGAMMGAGLSANTNEVRGIRFQPASGTITTGTFKLYGIRKT